MFDVLVYLFQNYYTPTACPELDDLCESLEEAGFEQDDITSAMGWLYGLAKSTENTMELDYDISPNTHRVYTQDEQFHLGSEAISFLYFLENSGSLSPATRELIIDRTMEIRDPISFDEFRIITLMVLWSLEAEIDQTIIEEFFSNTDETLH